MGGAIVEGASLPVVVVCGRGVRGTIRARSDTNNRQSDEARRVRLRGCASARGARGGGQRYARARGGGCVLCGVGGGA